jgi:hypothetical protein
LIQLYRARFSFNGDSGIAKLYEGFLSANRTGADEPVLLSPRTDR